MAKSTEQKNKQTRSRPPATTPEDRENELIALAVDLAEKKIRDGTASNQIIVHFLKQSSTKERLEKEIMEKQKELITAKTDALQANKRIEELYSEAMKAMSIYKGETGGLDEED